ncbi:nuclear receptor coactivator 7 [Chanos chanos]|uniref:Nuclear receptor coactivator 7 n=1 Tax=Chanos chanos TaxID=29144 RepID=A0A6J2WD67_CHACN|nr:nuclear receptor coactivator 7-like [Chanos chanos]
MDHKQQRDRKTRTSYFGNVKNRLGSRLPAGVTQPPGFITGPWDQPSGSSGAQNKFVKHLSEDRGIGPLHHHIRNPRLRQYYLQEGTSLPDNQVFTTKTRESERELDEQSTEAVCREDTVFSVASRFSAKSLDMTRLSKSPSSTLVPIQQLRVPESKATADRLSATATHAEPSLNLEPEREPDIENAPGPSAAVVSPSTDAEYDKLLDVEAVPMPDGQLCLLALPPECTQGEGPATVPYLTLFCRYITDRKGVVTGILVVTSNKIFFDPSKTHPLVKENGCEEYVLSCSVDSLASVSFFSDISHVHFNTSSQRWKGKKKIPKSKSSNNSSKSHQNETSGTSPNRSVKAVSALVSSTTSDLHLALGLNPDTDVSEEEEGGESRDMAEAERQMDVSPLEELVEQSTGPLGVAVLSSADTLCSGGQDTESKMGEDQECLKNQISAPTKPNSGDGRPNLIFVRMRQKQQQGKKNSFAALELGKPKTLPSRDTWIALSQESSDELYAYLSQCRPDLCIQQAGEEEVDEEDFVLLDDKSGQEDEEDAFHTEAHMAEDWEMVSVEEGGGKMPVTVDKEPEGLSEILSQSQILDALQVRELSKELPPRTVGHAWRLAFSMSRHGTSLKTLYRKLSTTDSPVILIIKDSNHQVFGSYLSHPLRPSESFYGTGETFLFLLHPRFKCFHWTGDNSFFIKGDLDSFSIGGGSGHFGLWLDQSLYLGRSSPCYTFNNCSLSETDDFRVLELEAWTFW